MNSEKKELLLSYNVVVNHEEQYSIWPEGRKVPAGWEIVDEPRSKEECLDYIEEVWTDIRPLSLRRAMAEPEKSMKSLPTPPQQHVSLVDRLCDHQNHVIFTSRPEVNCAALKRRLEEFGYIDLRFTSTRGETVIGILVDRAKSEWKEASFDQSEGEIRIVGTLKLDGVPLVCDAVIDLATLSGYAGISRAAA